MGKGKIKKEILKMHKKLKIEFSYDDIFCSFSKFKKSYFRKPNPGMILKAVKNIK